MKCLDAPLLEELLRGRPRSLSWLRRLSEGGEVATTEVSLFELSGRAGVGARGQLLRQRREAVHRLRSALSVLPLDAPSIEKAALGGPIPPSAPRDAPLSLMVWGICQAHGVDELLTTRARWFPKHPSAVKVVRV